MPTTFKAVEYTEEEIEALEVDEMEFPYSDKRLRYDGLLHQYIPTEYAFQERGVNIRQILKDNGIEEVDEFCKHVSFKFYLWAYQRCKLSGQSKINYMVARRGVKRNFSNLYEYRNAVIATMVYLGEYLATNGDISQTSGVDLVENSAMDISTLRGEDRDYPKGFGDLMTKLGLNYTGTYKFMESGIGKEW